MFDFAIEFEGIHICVNDNHLVCNLEMKLCMWFVAIKKRVFYATAACNLFR